MRGGDAALTPAPGYLFPSGAVGQPGPPNVPAVFSWCSDPCGCSGAPLLSLPAGMGTIGSVYPVLMDVAPGAGAGQVPSALTAGMWEGKISNQSLQFLSSIPLAECC